MMGTSDEHAPDLRVKSTPDDHRTMTLVFVKEKTLEAFQEALMAGRTAVWFEDRIIGREEFLEPLLGESVQVADVVRSGRNAWVQIRNGSSADVRLERSGSLGPAELSLPAGTTSMVKIGTATGPLKLEYRAVNFLTAPDVGLPLVLEIP